LLRQHVAQRRLSSAHCRFPRGIIRRHEMLGKAAKAQGILGLNSIGGRAEVMLNPHPPILLLFQKKILADIG